MTIDARATFKTTAEYLAKCIERVDKTDFFKKHGLSDETIKTYRLGYDPHFECETGARYAAAIIPTGDNGYTAYNIDDLDAPSYYGGRKLADVYLKDTLYNAQKPIYVVTDELNALIMREAGADVVGIHAVDGVNKLCDAVKERLPVKPLILALNNLVGGNDDLRDLTKELMALDVPIYAKDPYKTLMSAADVVRTAGLDALKQEVNRITAEVVTDIDALKSVELDKAKHEAVMYAMPDFMKVIQTSDQRPCYPTGFNNLDELLSGGLRAGLYVVGAISSLGKTTFCTQITDHIAAAGNDVLIFSLEMSKYELIAKSISRISAIKDMDANFTMQHAKSTLEVLDGASMKKYTNTEKAIIQAAIEDYKTRGEHIYISEGVGNIGVKAISERVRRHKDLTGKAPIVLIDYLQILEPVNDRYTDKQNTDKSVLELKRLSRDLDTPVIAISNFNRDNYTAPVNMSSFKESGTIEYSADVLIGLQYDGMEYQDGEKDADRLKRIRGILKEQDARKGDKARDIELKVLKNRNGMKGTTKLEFYSSFNYFLEKLDDQKSKAAATPKQRF